MNSTTALKYVLNKNNMSEKTIFTKEILPYFAWKQTFTNEVVPHLNTYFDLDDLIEEWYFKGKQDDIYEINEINEINEIKYEEIDLNDLIDVWYLEDPDELKEIDEFYGFHVDFE